MEQKTFGERLKQYRQEKRLTQQDLADHLGVSNKTISRWESDGGSPDVSVLVPLARVLGVTVDDLLDGEKPVRTLTRADYQSLLSFGFTLGGGVLFFLFDLFMPAFLCWLGYLGCMAYGVYLQKYYSYQSRWFFLSNAIMNLSVNFALAGKIISSVAAISVTMNMANADEFRVQLLWWLVSHQGFIQILVLFLALLLTVITQSLVWRWSKGENVGVHLREKLKGLHLERDRLTLRKAIVLLVPVAFAAFWLLYEVFGLPLWLYELQGLLFAALAGVCVIVCLLLFLKRGRRWQMLPALGLTALCSVTWSWTRPLRMVARRNGYIYNYKIGMNEELYIPFREGTPEIFLLLAGSAVIYLACCFIRITKKPIQKGESPAE